MTGVVVNPQPCSCLRCLKENAMMAWIYWDFLDPTDSGIQAMRKTVSFFGLLISWCAFIYTIVFPALGTMGSVADVVGTITAFSWGTFFLLFYLWTRYHRMVTNTATQVWALSTELLFWLTVISYPSFHAAQYMAVASISCCICMWVDWIAVHIFIAFAGWIVFQYNASLGSHYRIALPNPRPVGAVEVFVGSLCSFAFVLWIWIMLRFQQAQHLEQVERATHNAELCAAVVQYLARLDTERVRQLVQSFSDTVDPALAELMTNVADTFEEYKPHIPSYVFADAFPDPEGADGVERFQRTLQEDELSDISTTVTEDMAGYVQELEKSPYGGTLNLSPEDRKLSIDTVPSAASSSGKSGSQFGTQLKQQSGLEGSPNPTGRPSPQHPLAMGSQLSLHSVNTFASSSGSSATSPQAAPFAVRATPLHRTMSKRVTFEGRVTIAQLRMHWRVPVFSKPVPVANPLAGNKKTRLGPTSAEVDGLATSISTALGAAGTVHSFVGDSIVLSWNATHRVPSAEIKAVQSCLGLRLKLPDTIGTITGAIACGPAAVHFPSVLQQKVPLIHGKWIERLEIMEKLAAKFSTLLIDYETFSQAQYFIQAHAVARFENAAMLLQSSTELGTEPRSVSIDVASAALHDPALNTSGLISSDTTLFEVMSTKEAKEQGQGAASSEWMYQLREMESGSWSNRITKAFNLMERGENAEALAILQELPDPFKSKIVLQLMERCR